jgi:hypothetical protein
MSIHKCPDAEVATLMSKLSKDSNQQVVLNSNGLPMYNAANGGGDISGNDLACWMSIDLAKRERPAAAPALDATISDGYTEMYDNTLLAATMMAILGGTLLYFTITGGVSSSSAANA